MLARVIEEAPAFFGYYNLIFLLHAMLATFLLSAIGCLVGFVVGFALAVMRRAETRAALPLKALALLFVEAFRRIPFLVTLMLTFFVFQFAGIDIPIFWIAVVSVCLIASAFIAEIVRSGLDYVHRNQWDAAAAMNMGYFAMLRLVIVPQAWKVILPPAFSFFILFIKDTALASQIGVMELTYAGKILNNKGFSAALVFGSILVLYFVLSYPLARLGAWMEARLAPPRDRAA
jgi:polar amino acid transport system permease protein